MALPDVLDGLVKELVGDVAHIAFVVDIDDGFSTSDASNCFKSWGSER